MNGRRAAYSTFYPTNNRYQPAGQQQSHTSNNTAVPMELGMLASGNNQAVDNSLDGYTAEEIASEQQHINAIQQVNTRQSQSQRGIPNDKYQYCRQNRLCFWCEQPNHTSFRCPSRTRGGKYVYRPGQYPKTSSSSSQRSRSQPQ